MTSRRLGTDIVAAVPLAVGLNLSLAYLVNLLKLPLFLDSSGTILMGALFGPVIGALTGIISNSVAGLVLSPVYFWFIPVAAFVGACGGWVSRRVAFRPGWRVIAAGLLVGLVSAVIAAPIATYVFGGVTPAGSYSVIVAFAKATGQTLLKNAFLAGIASDPADKAVSFLIASMVVAALPASVRERFRRASGVE